MQRQSAEMLLQPVINYDSSSSEPNGEERSNPNPQSPSPEGYPHAPLPLVFGTKPPSTGGQRDQSRKISGTCRALEWSFWQASSCSTSDTSSRLRSATRRESSPTTVTCFDTVPDIFLNCG